MPVAARDEGFAELTVAARNDGAVGDGFAQLTVAGRSDVGVGEAVDSYN